MAELVNIDSLHDSDHITAGKRDIDASRGGPGTTICIPSARRPDRATSHGNRAVAGASLRLARDPVSC